MAAKVVFFLLFIGITTGTNSKESCPSHYPECNCEYKDEPCPDERPVDCSSEYECPIGTNKPCCKSDKSTPNDGNNIRKQLKPCNENYPTCNCEYKFEPCPDDRPQDCSSEYFCSVETNKPCCE